ncbi:hypothetical protein [Methanolobus sp. ZRKC5]|uniref:hypothetical protein n=1 Tax=unclassified Methanolobus TaxID=2629569 RepID=UPI00313C75EA
MKEQSSTHAIQSRKYITRYAPVFLMLCVCCVFLQAPVLAHADILENASNHSAVSGIYEQAGISEYNHLIELYFEENDYVLATESIVYSTDSANGSEEFVLWIAENAEVMQFQVSDMASGSTAASVNYSKEGDFLYFPSYYGTTESSGMPLLYSIRYATHSHEEVPTFRKVIREDGVFDYPISRLIIVVNHEESEIPAIISADGLTIVADETINDKSYTSYIWSSPQFNEFSISLEKNNDERATIPYNSIIMLGMLGIIIVIIAAAILYYRKGSSGNLSEFEDRYEAELAVLAQLKEDKEKKKLSNEEFGKLHKKHSENALKIKRKMEKLKKT